MLRRDREPPIISPAEARDGNRFWHEAVDYANTIGWITVEAGGVSIGYTGAAAYDKASAEYQGRGTHIEAVRWEHIAEDSASAISLEAAGLALLRFSSQGRRYEARYANVLRDYHGTFRAVDSE